MMRVACCVVTRAWPGEDVPRVMLTQRRADTAFPLTWEFPGGKIEQGESASEAAMRELQEETGIDGTFVKPGELICTVSMYVDAVNDMVTMDFLHIDTGRGCSPALNGVIGAGWFRVEQVLLMDVTPGSAAAVGAVSGFVHRLTEVSDG